MMQVSMMCLFFFYAIAKVTNVYLVYASMMVVGLIGGLGYINCLYGLFKDEKITKDIKEVSASLNAIFGNIGVFSSSIFGYIVTLIIF